MFPTKTDASDKYHDPAISLPATYVSALGICLESGQEVLGALLSLDLTMFRCLPSFYFVWSLVAAVCMVKMAPYIEYLRRARLGLRRHK